MRTQSSDTSPEAERVLIELLRAAPPWRKLSMIEAANHSVRQLALQGLCERHPGESAAHLRRRLASLLLGEDLARLAYGPKVDEDEESA